MFFAYDKNDRRIHIDKAVKGQDYFCPCCGASLLQKKGKIRQHHFSHSKENPLYIQAKDWNTIPFI